MNLFKKHILWLASMTLFSYSVHAHEQANSLGAAASAVDMFAISCSDGTDKMFFSILANKASSGYIPVSATLIGDSTFTTTSNNGKVSHDVEVSTKSGVLVMISKTKAEKVNYAMTYHCQTNGGEHTETDLSPLQNQ